MSPVSTVHVLRKTRRGAVFRVARERYLRNDVHCGLASCPTCPEYALAHRRAALVPADQSVVFVLHPDVAAAQLDLLTAVPPAAAAFVVLESVFAHVNANAPRAVSARLRKLISSPDPQIPVFSFFSNNHHHSTAVDPEPTANPADTSNELLTKAASWLATHWSSHGIHVAVLVDGATLISPLPAPPSVHSLSISEWLRQPDVAPLADLYAQPDSDDSPRPKIQHSSYLPPAKVASGLATSALLQGKFRLSDFDFLQGHVLVSTKSSSNTDQPSKYLVDGRRDQNRAIDGDVVIIRPLPQSEWRSTSSRIVENNPGQDDDPKHDAAADHEKPAPQAELVPTAQVVAIASRNWRPCCGTIDSRSINQATGTTSALVLPVDKKIPKIRIRSRRVHDLVGKRLVIVIDSWDRGSMYPSGHLVREIGENGDKAAETEVLLLENEIPTRTFSPAAMACLPGPDFTVTQGHRDNRTDLRACNIASVDPPGCTDIDDALHCGRLPNGNYEVGIHIADVTAFVGHGSVLDLEAAERGTSVYLVDRRIEMLPSLLSGNLCSLRPGVERLAFSILLEMDEDAHVVSTTFHRSVIQSKQAFTYEAAQKRIDASRKSGSSSPIDESLLGLADLAKKLRQRRVANGALNLASPEVSFKIDHATNDVTEVAVSQTYEANGMVAEYMLLANTTVAEKLLQHFPQCSLLRRHPRPTAEMLEPLERVAKSSGLTVDATTSRALNESLDKLEAASKKSDGYLGTLMRILTTRCMSQAVCFSSGEVPASEYLHYGLAAPVYTHFTSPIRRYTDVIVHRLLSSCLGYTALPERLQNSKKMQEIAEVINVRHRCAQFAGRASVALHTILLFKDKPTTQNGRIMRVLHNGLVILVPKYGIEGVAYLSSEDEAGAELGEDGTSLRLRSGKVFRVLASVKVRIEVDSTPERRDRVCFSLV